MGIDVAVVERRLGMILSEVEFLRIIGKETYDIYKSDEKSLRATSKAIESIAQYIIDICSHIVAQKHWGVSETYGDCISKLETHKIISGSLSKNLQLLISMRNLLVHEYGKVDHEIVWNSIESIESDSMDFVSSIKEYLSSNSK